MKAESHGLNGPLYIRYLGEPLHPGAGGEDRGRGDPHRRSDDPSGAGERRGAPLDLGPRGGGRVQPTDHREPHGRHPGRPPPVGSAHLRRGGDGGPRVRPTGAEGRGPDRPDPGLSPCPEEPHQPVGSGIRRLITKAAVETLASRFLADRGSRTLVLCRGSTNQYRNELLYRLVELLNSGGEIPIFPAISDAPTLSAMNHFHLAISSRGVRADATWTLLDASIDHAALPPIRGKSPMYSRIAEAFAA